MPRPLALTLALIACCLAAPAAQRGDDGGKLLLRYVAGERELALPASFDYKTFLNSVGNQATTGVPGPPERARRATAAFVLEVAAARLGDGDVAAARALVEWACGRLRAHASIDAFDIAWHSAALSVMDGLLDPVALEAHVQHARVQWPGGAVLALSWAIAAEQRSSPLLATRAANDPQQVLLELNQARLDAANARVMDDAHERFAKAEADPGVRAEARIRAAHLYLLQQNSAAALDQLRDVENSTREGWAIYLARLFRGQALEALDRKGDAMENYRLALKVGPGGQTATMSLAALLFRTGQRDEAEALVQLVLAETDPISDPWWTYWAGSARLWTSRLTTLRGLIE